MRSSAAQPAVMVTPTLKDFRGPLAEPLRRRADAVRGRASGHTYAQTPWCTDALVVDCRVLAGAPLQESWQDEARPRIAGRRLCALQWLANALCSVALRRARQGAIVAAHEGLVRWQELAVESSGIDAARAHALARRDPPSACDASGSWLAARLKCPRVTFNEALAQVAQQHLTALDR